MPYTLFQGGRRRRRRRAPGGAGAPGGAARPPPRPSTWSPSAGAATRAAREQPPQARAAGGLEESEPLAGGGTAPSPLAVRLDQGGDPVRTRFKNMPRSGLLFDIDTGRVLWRHQPTRVLPIASLTKMMTALIVADRLGPRTRVPITREALRYQGSGVGLLPKRQADPHGDDALRADAAVGQRRRDRARPARRRLACRGSSTR